MRQYSASDFRGFFYAHRGLYDNHHGVPENSLPAFRAAAEKGYGVELDVQLSADGQVVVFHDDTLDRICGVHGKVIDYPLEQLQELFEYQQLLEQVVLVVVQQSHDVVV